MAKTDTGQAPAAAPVPAVLGEAAPLIHLDELDALDLLGDFVQVFVPEAVWAQVLARRAEALHRHGVRLQRVALSREPDDAFLVLVRALSLGAGVQQAIELGRQHAPAILLADDAAARLAARTIGLRVHGTLGVLMRAARLRQRTPEAVLALLERLPSLCSLRLRAGLLDSAIEHFKIEHDLD
jgi:predicted nucleic acid-binding protein